MILNDVITLQKKTRTRSAEGMLIDSWADDTATIKCSFQPKSLTESQLSSFGVTNLASDAKVIFYYPDNRLAVMGRLKASSGEVYECRAISKWPRHYEAIAIPIQGN
jgi:head-tail adaptor